MSNDPDQWPAAVARASRAHEAALTEAGVVFEDVEGED